MRSNRDYFVGFIITGESELILFGTNKYTRFFWRHFVCWNQNLCKSYSSQTQLFWWISLFEAKLIWKILSWKILQNKWQTFNTININLLFNSDNCISESLFSFCRYENSPCWDDFLKFMNIYYLIHEVTLRKPKESIIESISVIWNDVDLWIRICYCTTFYFNLNSHFILSYKTLNWLEDFHYIRGWFKYVEDNFFILPIWHAKENKCR